jgi:hypothetical protein
VKKDQAKGTVKDIVAKRKTVPADMKNALRTADECFRAAADASLDSLFVAKGVRNEAGYPAKEALNQPSDPAFNATLQRRPS